MTAGVPRRRLAALADPSARQFLRDADPVLARLIDARPDFRPRSWMDELPTLDAFGTLIFQVAGQQLSVRSTRAIISRLQQQFGGHMPPPPRPGRSSAGGSSILEGTCPRPPSCLPLTRKC